MCLRKFIVLVYGLKAFAARNFKAMSSNTHIILDGHQVYRASTDLCADFKAGQAIRSSPEQVIHVARI
jgi:hypothetical protein